jgi:hypothetical protein
MKWPHIPSIFPLPLIKKVDLKCIFYLLLSYKWVLPILCFEVINKLKRKWIFGLLALLMLIASVGSAFAFGAKLFGGDSESREKIVEAIEAKDYNAWKEAMSAQLTEENFNKLVARHESMSERQAQMEAIEQAIQKGDYEAWKKAVESMNSEMMLDEENFKILVQLHQARENGDYETVKELSEQLGLPENLPQRCAEHGMFGGRGRMV